MKNSYVYNIFIILLYKLQYTSTDVIQEIVRIPIYRLISLALTFRASSPPQRHLQCITGQLCCHSR